MFKKKLLFFCVITLFAQWVDAQNTFQSIKLDDLTSFKPQAGNWMIVGDVAMNRNIDIHPKAEVPTTQGKKKKKSSPSPEPESPVTYQTGQGILLNINSETKKDNLVTTWEHGDIELELELMLPKGSNSGLYLQGAYEVQLFDSWGVEHPSFSDIGGIYRNWENAPDKAYAGKAPLLNAAKAPGLWQKLKVAFQAPKFNAQGEKIANARFIYVELNGIRIHENVEVPQMTGGSILKTESVKGPIMIQGDHGPVAFRNMQYRLLKDSEASVSELNYQVFYGKFENEKDFAGLKPNLTGTADKLTWEVAKKENDFAVKYMGKLNIPEDGLYNFSRATRNDFKLILDGKTLIDYNKYKSEAISLQKGSYPFEIVYFKSVSWHSPYLGLFVEGANTYPKALHSFNSMPPASETPAPIYVEVGNAPKLLRAFLDYKGNRGQRLTHTVAVGNPSGSHYIYDLKSGSVVCIWRGNFVDATPMWHDRGDGSFRPRGIVQYLSNTPSLAILSDSLAAFPKETNETDFRGKGYVIDNQGNPTFKYIYKGIAVSDKTIPLEGQKMFSREIKLEGNASNPLYYKLAEGKNIQLMKDGSYTVDDKQYYIEVKSSTKPFIRNSNGGQELVIRISNSINYTIIW